MEHIKKFEELELNPMKWEPIKELVLKNVVKKLKFPNVTDIKFRKISSAQDNLGSSWKPGYYQILFELKDSFTNLKNLGLDIKKVYLRISLIKGELEWDIVIFIPVGDHEHLSIDGGYHSGFNWWWNVTDDKCSVILSPINSIGKFKPDGLKTIIDGILRDLPTTLNELRTNIPIWIKRRRQQSDDYEKRRKSEADRIENLKKQLEPVSDLFYELEELSSEYDWSFNDNSIKLEYKIKGLKVESQRKSQSVNYRTTVELDFNEAHLEITDELLKVFKIISTAKKRVESLIPSSKLIVKIGNGWVKIIISGKSFFKIYNEVGGFGI